MSSLEISELTGKRHDNVLRDIRGMLDELYPSSSELSYKEIQGVRVSFDDIGRMSRFELDKSHTLTLVTGYSHTYRKIIIDRWQFLEDQLTTLKFREGDKKHQLAAMEALSHLLPEDLKGEELAYMKANTVVNKATSNLFGFPKMLKKAEMSDDMLQVREKVLDDYIKLFEVVEDNGTVTDILYKKYQPDRLESK
jgi:phage regulator Rha-like protein